MISGIFRRNRIQSVLGYSFQCGQIQIVLSAARHGTPALEGRYSYSRLETPRIAESPLPNSDQKARYPSTAPLRSAEYRSAVGFTEYEYRFADEERLCSKRLSIVLSAARHGTQARKGRYSYSRLETPRVTESLSPNHDQKARYPSTAFPQGGIC